MTADEIDACAAALELALGSAGIVIERPNMVGGSVKHWETVPAYAVIGSLLQRGMRVRVVRAADRDLRVLPFELVTEEPEPEAPNTPTLSGPAA